MDLTPAALLSAAWDGPLFAADFWKKLTYALRIALTFGGALLLMYEIRARRLDSPIPERTRRWVAIVMSVLAFGVYYDFFNPNVRYPEYYHRHVFFHHYLGAKYFEEIRYHRLYECAAAAEIDLGRGDAVARRELRDLRDNQIKPVSAPEVQRHIQECRDAFAPSPQRWEAFKKDIDWFYEVSRGSYWDNMQKDHGFNAPPVWTMGGKFFTQFGSAGGSFFKFLCLPDIALQAGAMLLIFWAFGWRVGAIATIFWGTSAVGDFYWLGGAFLRQDWFFLLVAALCLARKRHFFLAGAALTWSSLLRVFPVVFFAGWGIIIGLYVLGELRGRHAAGRGLGEGGWLALLHRDHRRLLAGCFVAAAVLVPASMLVVGPSSYRELATNLRVHMNTPLTDNMGLRTILTHHWDGRMRFARDDNLDDPFERWKAGRLERRQKMKPVHYALVLGIGAWMVWALRRTKLLWVGLSLSCLLAMSLVELSSYYLSMFVVAVALARPIPGLGPIVLVAAGASQVVGSAGGIQSMFYWIDDKFTAQSYLFFLFGALLLYGYSRPVSLARFKAWWRREPEPLAR
jgi:hypothetical protein